MLDVWSWLSELPVSETFPILELASSKAPCGDLFQKIQLRATTVSENSAAFSICLEGFHSPASCSEKVIWVSDACDLLSEKPFLPLVLQVLREIVLHPSVARDVTCPRSRVQDLSPDPVAWLMDSYSPESFSEFFNLVLLTRLFRLCVFDVPSDVGSFFFNFLLGPNVEQLLRDHGPVLRAFLATVGVDMEVSFMRAVGYMLVKWLILREVGGAGVGLQSLRSLVPRQHDLAFSYVNEAHGLWVLKGFAPVGAMRLTRSSRDSRRSPVMEAKDSVLKYVLAHQQLEAVIQLEYSVRFHDGYIHVKACVDNVRLHVVRLGLGNDDGQGGDEMSFANERHFPSRVRVWVGPEAGARYVGGLSLGRSTNNIAREVETERVMKGTFGKSKVPSVKPLARTSMRTRASSWRWDQDAEGNSSIFDAVLSDSNTGREVASLWTGEASNGFRRRYSGANRPFTKKGGLIFSRDECGEGVGWRLNKEMEGSVLKWRIGGQVWLSYLPNEVDSSFFETRLVEWCDEVDLPLILSKEA